NNVNEWRNIVGLMQNKVLQTQKNFNQLMVTIKTLEDGEGKWKKKQLKKKWELEEKVNLIDSMQQEMGQMKEEYELQLRGVEVILVNNGTEYFAFIYFFFFYSKKKVFASPSFYAPFFF
ncbi:hypothetical protein RFI_38922, partial [Reticulomyxa filosa]